MLFLLHKWIFPWLLEKKVFSSVNIILDQNSKSSLTYWRANASLPSRCCCARNSLTAGVRWWIPDSWSLLRIVAVDTCSCKRSWMSAALVKRLSSATLRICSSCWGVVSHGRGLLALQRKKDIYIYIYIYIRERKGEWKKKSNAWLL